MSARFDTINYTMLMDHLSLWYGVSRVALSTPEIRYGIVTRHRVFLSVDDIFTR